MKTERQLVIFALARLIFKDKGGNPVSKLINCEKRRTMIFAQSGFGKTNLVKVLLQYMYLETLVTGN